MKTTNNRRLGVEGTLGEVYKVIRLEPEKELGRAYQDISLGLTMILDAMLVVHEIKDGRASRRRHRRVIEGIEGVYADIKRMFGNAFISQIEGHA